MDSLKLPKGSSATSSASGSNSNLSGSASTSVVGSLATSPTSVVAATVTTAIKAPPGLNSSTPISVRFNANEESLDDILQQFHHNTQQQHSHSPSGGGGGDASPTSTLLGIKNNGSVGAALGMMVNACDSHSLSSSPSQQHQQHHHHQHQQQQATSLFGNDEVNLRNNYLQSAGGGGGGGGGGFFNRKRSGSIERVSPTTSGPNLISALSSSVTAVAAGGGGGGGSGENPTGTVGTWKLIKGKVSQTIEEIKSSKHHSQPVSVIVAEPVALSAVGWTNEADSDSECITINTPVSEEFSLTLEQKQQQQQHNSDSDPDTELLQHDSSSLGSGDVGATAAISIERSRLRRGLAHIKSKVKAKQQAAAMNKKELSTSPSGASALRSSFLRRRNNAEPSTNMEPSTSSQAEAKQAKESASTPEIPVTSGKAKRGIVMARKDVEIESGVEVHEDMIPTGSSDAAESQSQQLGASKAKGSNVSRVRIALDLPIERQVSDSDLPTSPLPNSNSNSQKSIFSGSRPHLWASLSTTSSINWRARSVASPVILVISLVVLLVIPLPDFLRGVLATVLAIVAINWSSSFFHYLIETYVLRTHPERTPFRIPNYYSMPICEIPAVEEHKTIKTYSGWLNEINSYDPATFSVTMTRSVYVRLDGSVLKLSGTNARIPKRRMWNEVPIDRTKVLFTDHRSYDLRDCRIELLPVGLAKKRFFNRKYPIQLIIKNTYTGYSTPQETISSQMDVQAKESKLLGVSNVTPPNGSEELEKTIDFGATVLQADLQQLRNTVNPDLGLQEISIPCGDEVRLLLFARCDREKEDWYRRFIAASKGIVHEQELHVPMIRFVEDTDLQAAAAANAVNLILGQPNKTRVKEPDEKSLTSMASNNNDDGGSNTPDTLFDDILEEDDSPDAVKDGYEGLIMNADVARNPPDYVKFMAAYQQACNQSQIPVCRKVHHDPKHSGHRRRKARRAKRQEDELWKGIDQSLFLGPSGSVVWANVILGRCLFSWLHDTALHVKIQDFMQKKLNSIKLPSFMEEVVITNIYLGKSPMLFHRMSQPMLDERGVWLDADVTYEGLAHITVTTKLNLLRVRSKPKSSPVLSDTLPGPETPPDMRNMPDEINQETSNNAIYDSDAESSGGSSSDAESPPPGVSSEPTGQAEFFQNSPGNARRIFKIVDRIATSNLFQYATELPYVQRAMENMNANLTLRVELKGLVARGTLNIPPPPSDRVWMCFRGPPRLWISTKPQVGDKSVDWSIVTNVIESKLCEAVNKYLVYPNMVDFSIPFLGKPTYEDEPPVPGPFN
ncbi:uncharacterized protein LOC117788346 isoform X1 [Drosophila innubila]|uniref:uncharacterized protein LOC117788346 isoform X1 n=1 Tax=Drosophila innubila TaxID=198719 RepID=UPI00148D6FB6|nr:uncharacterized protein LOC117788346 isoform X1 [Drosophila innubila]XP_034482979.1 uncharacterized protein LOC117788346 isoform X1 [Drosophila innubila]XP_034482980.1 uncharacterized protein LOC117788346 isoform X1 [Drosophila innubila]